MNIHDLLTVLKLGPLQTLDICFRDATWSGVDKLSVTGGSNKYELVVSNNAQEIVFHLNSGNIAKVNEFVSDINYAINGISNIDQFGVFAQEHTNKKKIGFPIHQNGKLIMSMIP